MNIIIFQGLIRSGFVLIITYQQQLCRILSQSMGTDTIHYSKSYKKRYTYPIGKLTNKIVCIFIYKTFGVLGHSKFWAYILKIFSQAR